MVCSISNDNDQLLGGFCFIYLLGFLCVCTWYSIYKIYTLNIVPGTLYALNFIVCHWYLTLVPSSLPVLLSAPLLMVVERGQHFYSSNTSLTPYLEVGKKKILPSRHYSWPCLIHLEGRGCIYIYLKTGRDSRIAEASKHLLMTFTVLHLSCASLSKKSKLSTWTPCLGPGLLGGMRHAKGGPMSGKTEGWRGKEERRRVSQVIWTLLYPSSTDSRI